MSVDPYSNDIETTSSHNEHPLIISVAVGDDDVKREEQITHDNVMSTQGNKLIKGINMMITENGKAEKSDDDKSLESGFVEEEQSDGGSDDIYLTEPEQCLSPSSQVMEETVHMNSTIVPSPVTENLSSCPSVIPKRHDDRLVNTLQRTLLNAIGIETVGGVPPTFRFHPKNSKLAKPVIAVDDLHATIQRQLSQRRSSVDTTEVVLHSVACAFVQCAYICMGFIKHKNVTNGEAPASGAAELIVTVRDSMIKLISIFGLFGSHLGTSAYTDLLFPPVEKGQEAIMVQVNAIFIALTRERKILEPMLMCIIPLMTRWPFAIQNGNNSSSPTFAAKRDAKKRKMGDESNLQQTFKSLGDKAFALRKQLFALGEARWNLNVSHPYVALSGLSQNKAGNILRSNLIHLFLIELATQERWSIEKVGLSLRVVGDNGRFPLRIVSSFSYNDSLDRNFGENTVVVDMSITQPWLQEGLNKSYAELLGEGKLNASFAASLASPSNDSLNGVSSAQLLGISPVAGNEHPIKASAKQVNIGSLTPKSKLNEWFQRCFGIKTIKSCFQSRNYQGKWTCVFMCPITKNAFPSGQYGTRREAEHAAADRMIYSLAQMKVSVDCEELAIALLPMQNSNSLLYCRDSPLPVQTDMYVASFRLALAAKAVTNPPAAKDSPVCR